MGPLPMNNAYGGGHTSMAAKKTDRPFPPWAFASLANYCYERFITAADKKIAIIAAAIYRVAVMIASRKVNAYFRETTLARFML